mgnify:FL=1
MRTLSSKPVKKRAMQAADAELLNADFAIHDHLLHTMVSDMLRPGRLGKKSLFLHYRGKGLATNHVQSLTAEAKGIVSAAKEALALNIKTKTQQIAKVEGKIKDTSNQLSRSLKAKENLKARSLARKNGGIIPPFKNPFGSWVRTKVTKDGLAFFVGFKNGKREPTRYGNEYLFETLYLDPRIRRLKSNINNLKCRLHDLKGELARLEREKKAGVVHICFGGKKAFRQRREVRRRNELRSGEGMWKHRRRREMPLVGRLDGPQGSWMARYDVEKKIFSYQTYSGKWISIPGVEFPYGQGWVEAAVSASEIAKRNKKLPPDQQIPGWPAGSVSWSLKDCGNAVQVKCMVTLPEDPNKNFCYDDGCVAFDMNYDHFAASELGPQGELQRHWTVPLQMEGRTSNQISNAISEGLEEIFRYAVAVNKPITIEGIEHPDKCLLYGNKKANRKISEFAHEKMTALAESKGEKYHLSVREVNPAYTSQIGKIKYMRQMGLSIHEAAAYVIGRRGMGLKDPVPKDMARLIPEKKKGTHYWFQWGAIYSALKNVPVNNFYRKINYREYESLAALKEGLLKA